MLRAVKSIPFKKKIKGMTFNVLRKKRSREEEVHAQALPPQHRLQPGHAGEMSDEQYEANVQRALVDSADSLPIRHGGSIVWQGNVN